MKVNIINVHNYLSVSKLPDSDFVINPYIGCPHSCKYCYASFMKKFTNHCENWGDFIDVKICNTPINLKKIKNKKIFLGSVTDCYNDFEKEFKITQNILKQLINSDAEISISTKNKLIIRDIEILKNIKNLTVCISINTLDETFKNDMDKASSIEDRIKSLKILHENKIKTVCFISPIFPILTDFKSIIEQTKNYCDEYWFENLNLRYPYRIEILNYIKNKHPNLYPLYKNIFIDNDITFWQNLEKEITNYCLSNKINFKNYFYHEKIKK